MFTKKFETKRLGNAQSWVAPETTAIQIENTADAGEVTVSLIEGGKPSGTKFTITAGQIQVLSGTWLSKAVAIECDNDSACQIIYLR